MQMADLESANSNCVGSHSAIASHSPAALSAFSLREIAMADRQGFEPWRRFPAYTRSRRAPSTTRPPVHFAAV